MPLEQYRKYLAGLRDAGTVAVTRDDVYKGFAHLVVAPAALDEIGPALNSGHSILLYGPSANGKTVIAHALRDLLAGDILVPYALEVEGSIIRVFDPVSHEARPPLDDDGGQYALSSAPTRDRRWVVCRRPMVKAGAELTLESLELSFDRRLGYYRAPLQLIANGGMILVDDFGRQRCSPRDLLNRWLVPLESGTEYLTLQSGMTFEVPFLALTVFATNIAPSELLDEAFLRRVRHKVLVAGPSIGGFIRIFENCCRERDVAFDRAVVEGLLDGYFRTHNVTLRGCQPRDLIDHALLLAEYRGAPRELTVELLETACAAYFVENRA